MGSIIGDDDDVDDAADLEDVDVATDEGEAQNAHDGEWFWVAASTVLFPFITFDVDMLLQQETVLR
jgi:hypothetical protein